MVISFGDPVSLLNRARAVTELLTMPDTCTVTRPGVQSTDRDPVTGAMMPVADTPVYSGKCAVEELRVQNPSPTSVASDFPVSMIATLKLPAMGPLVVIGDRVTLFTAPDHPQDAGLVFRVTSFNPKSQAKARLFQMQSVIG